MSCRRKQSNSKKKKKQNKTESQMKWKNPPTPVLTDVSSSLSSWMWMRPYVLCAFLSCSRIVFAKMAGKDPASPIAVMCTWSIYLGSNPGSSTDWQCKCAWTSHFLSLSTSLLLCKMKLIRQMSLLGCHED